MAIGIEFDDTELREDVQFNAGMIGNVLEDTEEIETHFHSNERWFEAAATPDGEVHVADRIGTGAGAFQIDAGNDDWGAWVQILGSDDTPTDPDKDDFDMREIQITAAERTALYYIQVCWGEDTTTALILNNYTEKPFQPQSVAGKPDAILWQIKQIEAKTKIWARCKCPGQNTATLDLLYGIHEYIKEVEN